MEFAQSPSAYPIGPCIVDWLSTNLNASLYLDASLDAFKVSLVTLPFCLFFEFPCVLLLGLNVVLLEFGSLMVTPLLGSLVVYKKTHTLKLTLKN